MIEQISLAFLELLVSIETLLILAGYLILCNLLVSRASELAFALALKCFWAVCFSYLLCRVFFADTPLFQSIASSWPWVFGTLLVLAILPALAIRALSRKANLGFLNFPPFLGLLHVIWLVAVADAVLWIRDLLIVPPPEILLAIAMAAVALTTGVGFALVGMAARAGSVGNEKARNTFTRIAGMSTNYIPICLYGAVIKSLYGS